MHGRLCPDVLVRRGWERAVVLPCDYTCVRNHQIQGGTHDCKDPQHFAYLHSTDLSADVLHYFVQLTG
jgi:hypothetical protein